MKTLSFVFITSLLSVTLSFSQPPITLGNGLVDGTIDLWNSTLVVDEEQTYTNITLVDQVVQLQNFNFYVGSNRGLVTPFLVKVNGNDNFTVIAIGTTRVSGADYNGTGSFSFQFNNSNTTIILAPGETIAPGFLNANPDGSGTTESVIPYIDGNEIWFTGHPNSDLGGSISLNNSITQGTNTLTDLLRSYSFSINIIIDPANAIPTLSQWGLISLSLITMVFGMVAIRKRLIAGIS